MPPNVESWSSCRSRDDDAEPSASADTGEVRAERPPPVRSVSGAGSSGSGLTLTSVAESGPDAAAEPPADTGDVRAERPPLTPSVSGAGTPGSEEGKDFCTRLQGNKD